MTSWYFNHFIDKVVILQIRHRQYHDIPNTPWLKWWYYKHTINNIIILQPQQIWRQLFCGSSFSSYQMTNILFLLSLTWNMIWCWRYDPCEYTRARLWKQQGRKSWPLWYWPRDNHMSYINTAHRGLDIYWIVVLGIISGPSKCKKEFYRYGNPFTRMRSSYLYNGLGTPV